MKLKDIPYYAKFIFKTADNETCFSTTDFEMIKFIVDAHSDETINKLKIGQKIQFQPIEDNPDIYKVSDISIRHLYDDTETMSFGFDKEDCNINQGDRKEWLFSLLIKLDKI
ncbi:hypothetical protein [uncultured Tenacibaculum sp.]|uniref:hypothetical protein n=1 Tax=uncultured Tenacibaculum sp. TaxID=174713 RepID=UPI00262F25DA|nr:hypothetical protein [uncultured Tenacibaculum sp.]